jgi:hypothetical protein
MLIFCFYFIMLILLYISIANSEKQLKPFNVNYNNLVTFAIILIFFIGKIKITQGFLGPILRKQNGGK